MPRDNHGLDCGIGQHFLNIADTANSTTQPTQHVGAQRGGANNEAMPPTLRQSAGHVNSIGMIS
jgi:hypothetical protein